VFLLESELDKPEGSSTEIYIIGSAIELEIQTPRRACICILY
jgi:hypothetical protein